MPGDFLICFIGLRERHLGLDLHKMQRVRSYHIVKLGLISADVHLPLRIRERAVRSQRGPVEVVILPYELQLFIAPDFRGLGGLEDSAFRRCTCVGHRTDPIRIRQTLERWTLAQGSGPSLSTAAGLCLFSRGA